MPAKIPAAATKSASTTDAQSPVLSREPRWHRGLLREELEEFEINHKNELLNYAKQFVASKDAHCCVNKALDNIRDLITEGRSPSINDDDPDKRDQHINNYMFRAVENCCKNFYEREKRSAHAPNHLLDRLPDPASDIASAVERRDLVRKTQLAVKELPRIQNIIVRMRVLGKSVNRIAFRLHLQPVQVNYQYKLARDSVKASLGVLGALLALWWRNARAASARNRTALATTTKMMAAAALIVLYFSKCSPLFRAVDQKNGPPRTVMSGDGVLQTHTSDEAILDKEAANTEQTVAPLREAKDQFNQRMADGHGTNSSDVGAKQAPLQFKAPKQDTEASKQEADAGCRLTAGVKDTITYTGECAIGFTGLEHLGVESAPSPVPGLMALVHGTVHVAGNAVSEQRESPSINVDDGSYVLMTNHYLFAVQYCEHGNCRQLLHGEHDTSGTCPQKWRYISELFASRTRTSARLELTIPAPEGHTSLSAFPPLDCNDIVLKGYVMTLDDNRAFYSEYASLEQKNCAAVYAIYTSRILFDTAVQTKINWLGGQCECFTPANSKTKR